MEYIKIGVIVKPHGIKGTLKVKTFTSFVNDRFKMKHTIYRLQGNVYVPLIITGARGTRGSKLEDDEDIIYLTFKEYADINLVEAWRGQELFVPKEEIHDLKDDEIYYFELMGASVYEDNQLIGVVSELIETGANLVLRVEGEKDFLIPYVNQFIIQVDKELKRIDVKLIEGMR